MSHFCEKNRIKWWGKIRIKSHIKISQGYINHKKYPPNQGNASSVKMLIPCRKKKEFNNYRSYWKTQKNSK